MGATPPVLSVPAALERVHALAGCRGRRILGIAGVPGAGKSTLARQVVDALGARAVYVPMDGFHLSNQVLLQLGLRERKGALDSFDAGGFVHLLRRLRDATESVVYAPTFAREIEEPIAGAIAVATDVSVVVTEGNYLLVERGAWGDVRGLLDEAWFVEMPEDLRLQRLIARHAAFGKSPEEARRWALGSDQVNAAIVAQTRPRADFVVRLATD